MIRAFGYGRVSSLDQVEQTGPVIKSSLELQRKSVEEVCSRNGWALVEYYQDPGISGESLSDRPAIQQMLKAAVEKKVDVIIVKNGDRLSRDSSDYMKVVKEMELKNWIAVHDISNPGTWFDPLTFNPRDSARQMAHNMKAMMSSLDQSVRIGRLLDGRIAQLRKGRVNRAVPIGYKWEARINGNKVERVPIPDDYYYPLLLEFPTWILEYGWGMRRISNELVNRGIEPPKSRYWRHGVLISLIKNPFLAGRIVIGRYRVKGDRQVETPEHDWEMVDHDFPHPWNWQTRLDMIRAIESRRNTHPRTVGAKNPLGGLLRCSNCGSAMYVRTLSATRKSRYYYTCSGNLEKGCVRIYQPVNIVLASVFARLDEISANAEAIAEVSSGEKVLRLHEASDIVRSKLAELRKQRDKIDKAWAGDVLSDYDYKRHLDRIETEEEQLKVDLDVIEHELSDSIYAKRKSEEVASLLHSWQERRKRLVKYYEQMSNDEALELRNFLSKLTPEIKVYGSFDRVGREWHIHTELGL